MESRSAVLEVQATVSSNNLRMTGVRYCERSGECDNKLSNRVFGCLLALVPMGPTLAFADLVGVIVIPTYFTPRGV